MIYIYNNKVVCTRMR